MPSLDVVQLPLTLKMTTAQVVETSGTVNNSPILDYNHLKDYAPPTYDYVIVFLLLLADLFLKGTLLVVK